MADHQETRLRVLALLLQVKRGQTELKEEQGLGVNGYNLYSLLGKDLTPDEFKADLDYLEQKSMVERKPITMPYVDTKAEELDSAWYSITASGTDEVEDPSMRALIPVDQKTSTPSAEGRRVFIVHGHDLDSLEKLDHLLRKIGLEPETFDSLRKEGSQTIIEVLERNMPTCDAVVALLTPDDEGRKRPAPGEPSEAHEPWKLRARQNVLIEAGYAIISRRKKSLIVALGGVEIPSDFDGIHRLEERTWSKGLARKVAKRFSDMGFSVNLGAVI